MPNRLMPPPPFAHGDIYEDPAAAGRSFTGRSTVCIGTFDGVHRGHQAILKRGESIAGAESHRLVVVTFHPHPKSVITPASVPLLLSEPEEKRALLKAYGAETVVQLRFDRDMAQTSALDFLDRILVGHLRVGALVFGDDFRFGHGREGTPDVLRSWGERVGCRVEMVDSVRDEKLNVRICSSLVREYLLDGRFDLAVALLGHAYPVSGVVVPGAGRGRRIGYPTWNLHPGERKLHPPVGIYAGWAGRYRPWPAMVYYGSNPTFGRYPRRLEAHLIDIDADSRLDPGAEETVWLERYVREEIVFDGADALTRQLAEDERRIRDMLITPVHNVSNPEEQ